jgi:hypothetical protein
VRNAADYYLMLTIPTVLHAWQFSAMKRPFMLHLCIVPAAAAHTSGGSLVHACLFLLLNAWGCGVSGSVWLGQ